MRKLLNIFTLVNRIYIFNKEENTTSLDAPNIKIFAIDKLYMKKNRLFDENNETNYGYLFPRDKIANFIKRLDRLVEDLDKNSYPKILFIDYDFSFSSIPYGKLSSEDKKLIDI